MDPSRFDAFTRACEAALSRRHALAAILGGLPIALAASSEAEGKRKSKRHQNKHKNKNKEKRRKKDKEKGGGGPPPQSSPCGPTWQLQTTFGSYGRGQDQFRKPTAVSVSQDGQTLCAVDNDLHRVTVWAKTESGWQAQAAFGSQGKGPNQFDNPRSLAIAADGRTIWVADARNNRISVWEKNGDTWANQTTFGTRGYGLDQFRMPYGVAVSADGQTLWVANEESHVVSVWTKVGGTWTPQTLIGGWGSGPSQFHQPSGVAASADGRTIWVADEGNFRVSVWAKNGDTWSNQATFGGCCSDANQFATPSEVAVSADGQTVWVADWNNDRVAIWTQTGSGWRVQTTLGGRGSQFGLLNGPHGVAVSPDGKTLWVADSDNSRIAIFTKTVSTWKPMTTFGRLGVGADRLDHPFGVTAAGDGQTVWVSDTLNDRMTVWGKDGAGWTPQAVFGNEGSREQRLSFPIGTAVSADGLTAWVADRRNSRIVVWSKATGRWQFQTAFGKVGSGSNEFSSPRGVAISGEGQTVWVTDTDNARISVWGRSGDTWAPQFTLGSRGTGSGQFQEPSGIVVGRDEQTVWVTDSANNRFSLWLKDGDTWRSIEFGSEGTGLDHFRNPAGLAVAPDERTIWVADRGNQRIAVWTQAGNNTWISRFTFGSEGNGPDQFRDPSGVAVSADEQFVWVADSGNNRISVWKVACQGS